MEIIELIVNSIQSIKKQKPILVAFDGVDTAGKTTLADNVEKYMKENKVFSPLRISIDKFHNPKNIRMQKGEYSPEGYFYNSFNYDKLIEKVLKPVKMNTGYITPGIFDYRTESEINKDKIPIDDNIVILFDGIFLNREEIHFYWDLSVFVDITFETMLKRALSRDIQLFESEKELLKKYHNRYIPGEKIYLEKCFPKEKSHIVIDNNNAKCPIIVKAGVTAHNSA
jgi:uridine kinase